MLYNAGSDPQLLAEVKRAKGLCHRYNQLEPMDFKAQKEILRELLGKVGERCVIYPPLWCSERFKEIYGDSSELVIVDGENHTITRKRKEVVVSVVSFFKSIW